MSNKKYKKLTDIEHVLLRPGRYLGSINAHTDDVWVYDTDSFVKREITWNPALLKMFDEVITNSVDESKHNSKLDTIKVTIEDDKIIVFDNGGIPVLIHEEHNQYIPEMIFGEMRAGSNFDDDIDSTGAGQNGEGSSLVNIFSTLFIVETCDGKKTFKQKFSDNLHKRSKPLIKEAKDKKGYTKISFVPDFERLGLKNIDEGTKDKIIKRVYDVAGCNSELKIYLNGKKIKFNSFKDYVKMHIDSFEYYEDTYGGWNVAIAKSEDGFQHVSFVNTTNTTIGGTHIDYVVNQYITKIREYIKKKHKVDVRPSDIKNQIQLFIDANIVNPRYSSQTKEELITEARDYKTSFDVPDKVISKILKSDIIQGVLDWVAAKQAALELKEIRKKGKSLSKKNVASHIPANSKDRESCTLFVTEGLSAISNLVNVRDPDIHGGFPLKGKPLNTNGIKPTKILDNVELSNLMSIVGLTLGEEPKNLNYGSIVIMADADFDGLNIVSLLINFWSLWPTLFKEKRIKILMTPIIIAKKGKNKVRRYYTMSEYEQDIDVVKDYEIEYLKGLGSLSIDEYERAINKPKYIIVDFDKDSIETLNMAFCKDKESSDKRKKWLIG